MSIESDIFQRCRPDIEQCLAYGFRPAGDGWRYEAAFMDGAFQAVLTLDQQGQVAGTVIDTMTGEEYLPLRAANPAGNYVYGVRHAYEELLEQVKAACFISMPFASRQANRICTMIQDAWGDAPKFLWKKKAFSAYGVFRHPVTQKWYGIIMPVPWEKIVLGRDGQVEVLDVKVGDVAARIAEHDACYPGYHMNKKYWISIALDDTMPDDVIWPMIVESHAFSEKGSKRK